MGSTEEYIPALKYNWLTGLYDTIMEILLKEKTFKMGLVAGLKNPQPIRILDLGCGTATLSIMIKRQFPQSEVIGLDGDNKVLKIAKRKARQQDADIQFAEALSFDIPFPDNHFDVVVSSLLFHHLTSMAKRSTLKEVYRVLSPIGNCEDL